MSRESNGIINNGLLSSFVGTIFEIGPTSADVAKFLRQIKQTGFVFNTGVGSMKRESYPVFCRIIRYPYQTGTS